MEWLSLIECALWYLHGAYAQTYTPIVPNNDTVLYNLVYEIFDAALPTQASINGDTTINNKRYHKVFFLDSQPPSLFGYLRQDTTHSKAWYQSTEENNEYLIMDLNLVVGDTFAINYPTYGARTATVIKVDTFQNRKRVVLDYGYGGGYISDSIAFIEGVGPNAFFMYQIANQYSPVDQVFGFLTCKKYINNVLDFDYDPSDFDCIYFVSTNKIEQQPNIAIFPNPNNGSFVLDLNIPCCSSNLTYKIYDPIGRTLQTGLLNSTTTTLSLAQKGFFYISVISDQQVLTTKLLRVQ